MVWGDASPSQLPVSGRIARLFPSCGGTGNGSVARRSAALIEAFDRELSWRDPDLRQDRLHSAGEGFHPSDVAKIRHVLIPFCQLDVQCLRQRARGRNACVHRLILEPCVR